MTDIVLNDITSGYNIAKINANFQKIEDSINNDALNLTGGNNIMGQDVDLNSHKLLNVGEIDAALIKVNGRPITESEFVLGVGVVGQENVQPAYDASLTKAADLASTATGKGSSLIGLKQNGTGSVASNLHAALIGFFFTPQMFGAVGDDTTDDTAAVQAWVNACGTYGYKGYVPAVASGYKLTAPIVVTSGFSMVGDGVEPNIGTLATTGVNTRGRGSWFHIAHTGVGFSYPGTPSARSGCLVQGIGTYRDQPIPNGGAYTPAANDYDFSAGAVDITFRDVMLLNPTNGISQTNAGYGRLTLENVRGQPLSIGINVDGSYDTGRVHGVHFWPFWTNDAGVRAYQLANACAFQLARWDNPTLDNCFCIGFAYMFYIVQSANGTLNKAVISNCDADSGGSFLFIASTVVTGATAHISNVRVQGNTGGTPPANACSIQINGSNSRLMLGNVELRFPQASCIRVQGTGNVVQATNLTVGSWNQVASSYRAIDAATSGNAISLIGTPTISAMGTTPLLSETAGSTISCPLARGTTTAATNASGVITITHGAANTPRHVSYAWLSAGGLVARPTGTYTATTFDVEVRDITAAGALYASHGVTIDWKVEF